MLDIKKNLFKWSMTIAAIIFGLIGVWYFWTKPAVAVLFGICVLSGIIIILIYDKHRLAGDILICFPFVAWIVMIYMSYHNGSMSNIHNLWYPVIMLVFQAIRIYCDLR
jgi:hypothetical protein